MAKREIITLIQKFIKRLLQEGITVEKAFLYGSCARGEDNAESDIDVMLVSDVFDLNDDQAVGKTWRIGRSIDPRLEPYTVGKKRFLSDEYSPILQVAKKEGLEIPA